MTDEPPLPKESPTAPATLAGVLQDGITRIASWADRRCETAEDKTVLMQRGLTKTLTTHIRRLEYQLRCFIIFLAARLIENGRVSQTPEPKRQVSPPQVKSLVQRQDEELRALLCGRPRLSGFSVTTPVLAPRAAAANRAGASINCSPTASSPLMPGI